MKITPLVYFLMTPLSLVLLRMVPVSMHFLLVALHSSTSLKVALLIAALSTMISMLSLMNKSEKRYLTACRCQVVQQHC